jgi:hypothetical protein
MRHGSRRYLAFVFAAGAAVVSNADVSTQPAASGLALRGATIYAAPDAAPISDGVVIVRAG